MSSKILVLGAGELGTAVLSQLAKIAPAGTTISVLLRPATISSTSPSKVKELFTLRTLNISFLPGDVATSSSADLSELLKPYDLIINCLGYASGPGSQIKITKAVLDAKVKRFIPWQFGADYEVIGRGSAQPVWDEQLDVRDLLRAQKDTEWIIVSTGMFMSFLFESFFGVVELGDEIVVRALGSWENQVTVTTPEDIGKLTSLIIFSEPRIVNEVVFVAGETISYGRLAGIVEDITGRKVRREVWTVEQLKQELKEDPENVVKKYRVVFAEGKGVSWPLKDTFNGAKGIEVTDVESFARKNLLEALKKS